MAGPWEKYATPAPAVAGPWAKYAAQPQPEPAAPAAPVQDTSFRADIPGTPQTPQRAAEIQQAQTTPVVNEGLNAPTYVAQRLSRSVADTLGTPVDALTGLVLNPALRMMNKDNPQIAEPFMGSDWIADKASQVGDMFGTETVASEQVGPYTRMAGEAARMGGGAALTGGMLASGPAQAAKGIVGELAKPYSYAPEATLARDTVAGLGAGAAGQFYEDRAPEAMQESTLGPLLKAAASILGGVGSYTIGQVVESTGRATVNGAKRVFGKVDPNAPVNPNTQKPFTAKQMDIAARIAQDMPANRAQTLENIDNSLADFSSFARQSEVPTTGMLADDVGMSYNEKVARTGRELPFDIRDNARRSLASDKVNASAPAGAVPRAFTNEATQQYDATLNTARTAAEEAAAKQAQGNAVVESQNANLKDMALRQPEASAKLDSQFKNTLGQARAEKNALYDAVPDTTPVSGEAMLGQLDAIDQSVPRAAKGGTDYGTVSGRLRSLLQDTDPTTGETIARDITYGDVKVLRADINAMRREAVATGKDVSYLDQVGRVLSQQMDTLNPEAAANYRENFAPKFKTGKVGEYESQLKRAERTGEESSGTRPSEFGAKFLKKPEDAAALNRAIDVNGNPVTAATAKEWMLGDLAKSGVLTDKAEIRYDLFRKWADNNKGVIDQFPEIRKAIDAEVATAQKGGMISKQLAAEVNAAKTNLKATEDSLQKSALRSVLGKNPENAVDSIMGSGDPEKQMTEMVSRLSGNKDATEGLKAATRDWIKTNAGVTSKIIGDPGAVRLSRAKLENLFRQNEKTLAGLYSPDEMNSLRQAHKLMDVEGLLDIKASGGSDSVSKFMNAQTEANTRTARIREAGLKLKFGNLAGGGLNRSLNIALSTLPNSNKNIDDLVFQMWFDPKLAKHLLTRSVKDLDSPEWNWKLNALLGIQQGARESVEGK